LEEQMSNPRKTRPLVPDVLVLAAVERAQRHRPRPGEAVPIWEILGHLDVARRSGAAREVRAQLQALEAAGALASLRRHSIQVWQATPDGRRRLSRGRRRGEVGELPESPQHRRWRDARISAGQDVERLREDLREALQETGALLDQRPPVSFDGWLEMGRRLHRACGHLGAASYCLREWSEPSDERPDAGHRNDLGWRGVD
jgi:hypothetical protein